MTHLSSIRSFEKLTAGGMTFLDADVVRVLEEVLPARFGGAPTDYQLVEDESEDGQPRVLLLVHPSLGPVGPDEMARTFLATIGSGSPPALAAPRPSGARRFPTAIAFGPSDYLRLLSEEMAIQPFNRLTVEAHRRDELAHGSIFTRGSPPACTGVCHAPRLQARAAYCWHTWLNDVSAPGDSGQGDGAPLLGRRARAGQRPALVGRAGARGWVGTRAL